MIGMQGIIKKIKERVGTTKPVYLSIDIDTLDPACRFFIPKFPSFLAKFNLQQSHLQLVRLRLGAGARVNSEPLSVVWKGSTSLPRISLR